MTKLKKTKPASFDAKDEGVMDKNNKLKVFAKQKRHKWHEVILTVALAMVALGTSLISYF